MRILYVEDSIADADLAGREIARYDPGSVVDVAPTLEEARRRLAGGPAYDVVLVDLRLPDGHGLDLLREIRRQGLPVAVVILTSAGDEETVVAALRGGADDYVAKREGYEVRLPTALEAALARFRADLTRRAGTLRVLYAEHHPADVALTRRHLETHAPHVHLEVVGDGEDVLQRFRGVAQQASPCDVLLLDYRLPGVTALDVLKFLREERGLDLPVVLVTGQGDEDVAAQALRLGATDYLVKNPNYLYTLPTALANAHHRVLLVREQAALQDSQARLAGVIDSAMDAIVSIDAEQRVVLFNPAAERMFGCPTGQALGQPLDRFIPERFRTRHSEWVEGFGRSGVSARAKGEFRTIHGLRADGSEFPIEASISHTRAGGKDVYTVILRDVTERTQRAERLRESEERFRQLADHVEEVFWMTDADKHHMLYVNPAYEKIWGRTREGLSASPLDWLEAVHPEDRPRVHEALARQARGTYDEEYRIVHPDGSLRWIHDRAFPVRDAAGQVYRVVGVAADVTGRRRAEEALRQSEEKFARAFDSSPDSLVLSRLSDGRLVEVNETFVRLSGYSREQALGRTTLDLGLWVDVEDRERYLTAIRDEGQVREQTARFRSQDGAIHDGLVSGAILRLGEERVALTTIRDVTERRRAEEQRGALEAQLRQSVKMEAVGLLAGGVAHDFNNMLSVILGYTDLALRKVSALDPIHLNLHAIKDAAERSADLTRQLLAFSRQQTITPRLIDLNSQLKEMERLLQRIIGEDVTLGFVLSPQLWPVSLDPSQVDQVVANLAVNSRDAMPEGGALTVETANVTADEAYCQHHPGARPGDYVMLAVSDTGSGMDEQTRERAFEPFFTTKPEGKGTGLGLATIYGIVKQNDGFVYLYSEVGQGTTLKLYFPRSKQAEPGGPPAAAAPAATRGDETILVVEDEEPLREIVRTLLEEMGYTVLEAATPGAALALCETHSGIDLLLTDVVMPVMSGKELADRIQARLPGVRTLFMSGYTAETIAHRGVLEPGIHFIQKPFSLDSLARTVREALAS